jgi:hypothetical protein
MPAVMPTKRLPHPHLYDRMVVAGVTPDFPRPDRPARWGSWLGVLIFAVNTASFMSIQFFVLDLLT